LTLDEEAEMAGFMPYEDAPERRTGLFQVFPRSGDLRR
jgi:hypothetical protein